MIEIHYSTIFIVISVIWLITRGIVWRKNKKMDWKRELQLFLVYICIVVIARFTFCPFGKVDGKIQPLLFDVSRIFPPRINLVPFVHMNDYAIKREAILNFVGNTAMFIPVGIVYPYVYKELNTHKKVIAAGVGFAFGIEILQLFFFDRVTDIDDLILNSLGYLIGYGIYLLVKKDRKKVSMKYYQ